MNSNETAAQAITPILAHAAALLAVALMFFASKYSLTGIALLLTLAVVALGLYAINNLPLRSIFTLVAGLAAGAGTFMALLIALRMVLQYIVTF